jgi:hypothetical protein
VALELHESEREKERKGKKERRVVRKLVVDKCDWWRLLYTGLF